MEWDFIKPTITLERYLIMNSAWQPLPRESPLKLMFKELYIKSSNSRERFKLQSQNICWLPCIFQWGDQRRRGGKGDKTTLIQLYYLNISATCDICFMQEKSKNVWGGLCIDLLIGARILRCQKYFPLPGFHINWARVKFANMTEAISSQNYKVTLCYLSDATQESLI